jgi:molybdopterin-guanine dinucleotide biosynthesis protein B
LIEGFKSERHPKHEVYRAANNQKPLHPEDDRIVAIASDSPFPNALVPQVDLNDIAAVTELVCTCSEPLHAVIARLPR